MRTEIYINNTLIDVSDDIALNLNYAIADIKTPDKRNSSYSKTITIPGSKTNNKLFSYIFDVSKEARVIGVENFTPDFNPNKKASCRIYSDTLLQFNGQAQMLQVNIDGDKIEYEIGVTGQLANLFTEIDGLELTNLDFSEYDHEFTRDNQKDSWDTSIIKNGSPYVNFSGGEPIGEGYVYPIIDYGYNSTSPIKFDVAHLFPAIYLKTYIDKIFQKANFTYTSAFFTSDFFKHLIIPFSGEVIKLSPVDVESRKFLADSPDPVTVSASIQSNFNGTGYDNEIPGPFSVLGYEDLFPGIIEGVRFLNDSVLPAFDNNNVYTSTYGQFRPYKKGTYDLVFYFKGVLRVTVPPTMTITNTVQPTVVGVINAYNNVITRIGTGNGPQLMDTMNTIGGGVYEFPFDHVARATGILMNTTDLAVCQLVISINSGIVLNDTASLVSDNITFEVEYDLDETYYYNIPVVNPLLESDTFLMNSAVPRKVSIKDFFLSIIKLFNLYVTPDPDNERNLIIEPQKDFYTGNSVVDWSDKLDLSKQILIKPVSEIEGKEYNFAYKEDKDYYNNNYQTKWSKTYGEYKKDIDNDFVKGKKMLDIIFSATPSVGNNQNNMVIPRIYNLKDTLEKDPAAFNPRILYYGGVKSVDNVWTYQTVGGDFSESYYSYAGHLDDPYLPSVDLLFELPEQIYWGSAGDIGSNYTNNNVYNIYYKQFIEEITDKDSKILTAYFRLRPLDIFKLSFKNFIHVNGINYRLNKVFDFNPLAEETTRVELSKIRLGIPFVPTTIVIDDTPSNPSNFGLIEGGEDEVRDLAATSTIHLIDGGEDVVIGIGSVNNINIVNGGQN